MNRTSLERRLAAIEAAQQAPAELPPPSRRGEDWADYARRLTPEQRRLTVPQWKPGHRWDWETMTFIPLP